MKNYWNGFMQCSEDFYKDLCRISKTAETTLTLILDSPCWGRGQGCLFQPGRPEAVCQGHRGEWTRTTGQACDWGCKKKVKGQVEWRHPSSRPHFKTRSEGRRLSTQEFFFSSRQTSGDVRLHRVSKTKNNKTKPHLLMAATDQIQKDYCPCSLPEMT